MSEVEGGGQGEGEGEGGRGGGIGRGEREAAIMGEVRFIFSSVSITSFSVLGSNIGHTLGLCYHKQREFQKAINAYSEAIQANKFFLDAYIGRGNVYMDLASDYGYKMAKLVP